MSSIYTLGIDVGLSLIHIWRESPRERSRRQAVRRRIPPRGRPRSGRL